MRQDVKRIATEAAALPENTISIEELYEFFMDVCRAENIRPAELQPRTKGNFLLAGKRSSISIKPVYFPESVRRSWNNSPVDYEELILARQEANTND